MRHLYLPPEEPLHRLYYEVSPRFVERGDLVRRISDSFERHPSRPILLYGVYDSHYAATPARPSVKKRPSGATAPADALSAH